MSLITTNSNRIVLKKAASMMVVPYVYDNTVGDYVIGNDVYDISAVIGDSITLEQSDGNTEAKYNEFKASPLIESVSDSKYAVTAQCLDLQDKILRSLFGAMTASNGAVAFNDDFVLIYALIRIRFKDSSSPDVILPKVQLNSKLFINQLKTRASQGNIAGSALSCHCAIRNSMVSATSFHTHNGKETYTPYTPLLFVPREKSALFFYKKASSYDYYTFVNFDIGSVNHGIQLNPSNGSIEQGDGGGSEGGDGGGGGGDNPND